MKSNTKLILGIIGGGLILLIILFIGLLSIIGGMGGSMGLGGTIALIPLEGQIAYGQSNFLGGTVTTPDTIIQSIKQADEDPTINAIVLQVNSPGGSPVASEEIMNAVKETQKPVVVWISDVGASGGYLVASGADKIVASPTSTVGSIGVIMTLTDLSGLYQKIGVQPYSIKAGEYKDMGADYRPLTTQERQMLQEMVNLDYEYFIDLVAQNRNLDKNYVRSIAEGKIYTGTQAKELKLIDETGGRQTALELAAKLGGITGSYETITITPPESLEQMLTRISSDMAYSLGKGVSSFMEQGSVQYSYTKR